jgi:hypothetical protein
VLADLSYTFLAPGCTPEGPEAPQWLEILAHISLVITAFFLIEIPLTLFAFGVEFYNPFGNVTHAKLHLFDAFIILTTFVLEVVLKGRERELAGLLIVLRLWRLIKLVGGELILFSNDADLHQYLQALQLALLSLLKMNLQKLGKSYERPEQSSPPLALRLRHSKQG